MAWQVTYRNKDGKRTEEFFNADDRNALFKLLAAKGINVIRAVDVGHAQTSKQTSLALASRIIMPGAILLIALVCIGWWLLRYANESTKRPVKARSPSTTAKRSIGQTVAGTVTESENSTGKESVSKSDMPEPPAPTNNIIQARFSRPVITLEDGTVIDARPVPSIKDPMERALAAAVVPGGMAIPFAAVASRFSEEEFMAMLRRPIEISADDSQALKERKMSVQQLKEDILDYIASGKTLQEAVSEMDYQLRKDNFALADAYKAMATVVATGDAELINAYADKLNENLTTKGLRPIKVPPKYRIEKKLLPEGDSNE